MDPKTDRRRSRISYRNNRNRSKSAEVSAEVEVNLISPRERERERESEKERESAGARARERHTVFSLADGFSDTKKLAIELNDGKISVRIRVEMWRGNGGRVIGILGMR